jgi:hypothetical protein
VTSALPAHVALVDETSSIGADELAHVAGALNEQVLRDFAPVWKVRASVGAYPQAPANTWAIRIRRSLDEPGALGYHTDAANQPVSYVMLTSDWSVTCSHELLEMLADPFGNRMHGGRLPAGIEDRHADFGLKHPTSHVSYLLEVADPPEATAYEVGDVQVSDFLTPAWYHATPQSFAYYSHAGGCRKPRQVAPGGYVSFVCPDNHWRQVFADRNGALSVQDLGQFDKARFSSLREFTDFSARAHRAP